MVGYNLKQMGEHEVSLQKGEALGPLEMGGSERVAEDAGLEGAGS